MSPTSVRRGGFLALTPLLVFLVSYLSVSLLAGDFYKMPISVAFVAASVYAVALMRGMPLRRAYRPLLVRSVRSQRDADDLDLRAGRGFRRVGAEHRGRGRHRGADDAPASREPAPGGLFLAACFVSLSVGTSVGTVVALVPVAAGLAEQTGLGEAWLTAIVVGGAFFGDNLSFISDTTIAATRTQECNLRDKFRVNVRIVAPAAPADARDLPRDGQRGGGPRAARPDRVDPGRALPAGAGDGPRGDERDEGAAAGYRRFGGRSGWRPGVSASWRGAAAWGAALREWASRSSLRSWPAACSK